MKITETILLDNYQGLSNNGQYISRIGTERVYWTYRKDDQDGTRPVCGRPDATHISLEDRRLGRLAIREDCNAHPSLLVVATDEAELWGDETKVDAALAAP